MITPIYSSEQHKTIVNSFIEVSKQFAEDVSSKAKYKLYLDTLDTIIEFHNAYGKGIKEDSWYCWLMIIPTNLSVMTNGYFAGIQNKKNLATIRSYKVILGEMLYDVAEKIDNLEQVND
tara:strand:+ start:82 stop:438 length:357 start_codon:yes stop_codon:yes gene_type:complete